MVENRLQAEKELNLFRELEYRKLMLLMGHTGTTGTADDEQ